MKHLSMWLTVLLLGAMPLAAAALDYGPNRPLVAAENGAPQLPGSQSAQAEPAGALPKPDVMDAEDAPDPSSAVPRVTPSASSQPASAGLHDRDEPSAGNKPRNAAPPKPVIEPDPASWRSLLPGSIQ